MIDDKKKQLLKKLQALAERGVGGEKETAQKKLDLLMKKYGIEELELSEEKRERYKFKYHNEYERILLIQLFYKIVPNYKNYVYGRMRGRGSKSVYIIECTKAQEIQLRIEYEFYCSLWKEEVDFFLGAFVQKHRIFATNNNAEDSEQEQMSLEDILRMQSMMNGMKNKNIMPALEEKGGE